MSFLSLFGPAIGAAVGLCLWFIRSFLERRQKRRDILIGLHAEIVAGSRATREQVKDRDAAIAEMKSFGTPDRTDFVFESIKNDISILPESVIYEVVRYYRLAEQSNLMTEDLRHDHFLAQPETDQRQFLGSLFDVQESQSRAADVVLDAIENAIQTSGQSALTERLAERRERNVR